MRGRLPLELVAVWLLFALVAAEIVVTYSRLPVRQLYHVSHSGLAGGASRALVFLNFPTALAAIAILVVLADRVSGLLRWVSVPLALVLCAAVFWPGVVDQTDLDAKPVNAIAAVGVAAAAGLTAVVWRLGPRRSSPGARGDRLRAFIAVLVLVIALPWIAADLGFYLDGVPLLGQVFQTGALRHQPGVIGLPPAVHHGHHHGIDGTLCVLTSLLLSRRLPELEGTRLRRLLKGYLALMFCYGVGNIVNDFWLEHLVKRGWTRWTIPDVTRPKVTVAWAVIVLAATALYALPFGAARETHC